MKTADQQVKVTVARDVAVAFKKACVSRQLSMAQVLSDYMAEYAQKPIAQERATPRDYSTRRLRRAAIRSIVKDLNLIKEREERSRDNTPENLQGSAVWERADEIIALIEEAIDALENAMVP
jgi:lipopolysaccharide biosynthesis protein